MAIEFTAGTDGSAAYGTAEKYTPITVKIFSDARTKSTYGTVTKINIGCIFMKIMLIPLLS